MSCFANTGRASRGLRSLLLPCFLVAAALVAAGEPPPLQLAERYHADVPLDEYWVSEKLDGVRAYWNGQRLLSRQGNPINAPAWFTRTLPADVVLDGELWMGRARFDELSGTVRALVPDDVSWRRVSYRVFDLPALPGTFNERLEQLRIVVAAAGVSHLVVVEQRRVRDQAALMRLLDEVVAAGGEGLMLQRGAGRYRGERSRNLLKLKRYEDAEAVVTGYTAGKGKYRGLVGALEVRASDGRRFRIGSGLSDQLRHQPPPLGSEITYKFYGLTNSGLPRFPVFMRVRDEP